MQNISRHIFLVEKKVQVTPNEIDALMYSIKLKCDN